MTTAAGPLRDDASPRWPAVTAVVGLLLVGGGVLVLRSPGARDVGVGWFAYGPSPSPGWLDSLVAWNVARELGAGLVLVGGVVLVAAAFARLAHRRRPTARPVVVLAGLGGLLVLGGTVAVPLIGAAARVEHQVSYASTVWTTGQLGAGLVVGVGLLVLAAAVGLRVGRNVSGPAAVPRTSS